MSRTVGVLVQEHIAAGLVDDNKVVGPLRLFPETAQSLDPLQSMPSTDIAETIHGLVEKVAGGEKLEAVGIGLDRKSTRLNSSHVEISYAVFCLKKKTTQQK